MSGISGWNNLDTEKESIIIDFKNFICRERNGSIMDIRFVKRDVLKEKPDQKHLGFGKI